MHRVGRDDPNELMISPLFGRLHPQRGALGSYNYASNVSRSLLIHRAKVGSRRNSREAELSKPRRPV